MKNDKDGKNRGMKRHLARSDALSQGYMKENEWRREERLKMVRMN